MSTRKSHPSSEDQDARTDSAYAEFLNEHWNEFFLWKDESGAEYSCLRDALDAFIKEHSLQGALHT